MYLPIATILAVGFLGAVLIAVILKTERQEKRILYLEQRWARFRRINRSFFIEAKTVGGGFEDGGRSRQANSFDL